LEPGETYSVELGYYAPPDIWNSVVIGNEVMMPFASEAGDEFVDVATVPFHLTFQQMLNAFRRAESGDLAQRLAEFQERAGTAKLTREESEILRVLELSPEDLQKTAAARASLEKSQRVSARAPFGGASPSEAGDQRGHGRAVRRESLGPAKSGQRAADPLARPDVTHEGDKVTDLGIEGAEQR